MSLLVGSARWKRHTRQKDLGEARETGVCRTGNSAVMVDPDRPLFPVERDCLPFWIILAQDSLLVGLKKPLSGLAVDLELRMVDEGVEIDDLISTEP